jgi:hypothetical protein
VYAKRGVVVHGHQRVDGSAGRAEPHRYGGRCGGIGHAVAETAHNRPELSAGGGAAGVDDPREEAPALGTGHRGRQGGGLVARGLIEGPANRAGDGDALDGTISGTDLVGRRGTTPDVWF